MTIMVDENLRKMLIELGYKAATNALTHKDLQELFSQFNTYNFWIKNSSEEVTSDDYNVVSSIYSYEVKK